MNGLLNLLKAYMPKWVAIPIVLLGAILIGMNYWPLEDHELPNNIKAIIQPFLTTKTLLTTMILFLSISICYILLCVTFYKKPNMKDYDFNSFGYYVHKKGGDHLCPKCLLTPPYIKAPFFVSQCVLKCSVCGKILTG